MAQKENRSEQPGLSAPADFAAMAQQRFEEVSKAQTELFGTFQETSRYWLDRIQAEANFASEFASRLAAARSMPDALATCQEYGNRRFEMITEDAKHVVDDAQKFMQAGSHILLTGLASASSGSTSFGMTT